MATLTPMNPSVYSGDVMGTTKLYILNGQSWKAGQFLHASAAGLLTATATNSVNFKWYALEDQSDPGNNTTETEVGVITSDMEFLINELDGSVDKANVGQVYPIDVTSNVVTLDEARTTTPSLKVVAIYSDKDETEAATDTKNRAIVTVLQSVLDAANA